ncbi:MAG: hypothetical protein F6J92_27100 [Symploca sp. SIO1A3]|nr:hypothetical protein [Symploca sp. SIO1A3]
MNAVVHHQSFLSDPHQAAREVWEAGSRQSAANSGVMRTSVLGIWYYWDSEQVRTNAIDSCQHLSNRIQYCNKTCCLSYKLNVLFFTQ